MKHLLLISIIGLAGCGQTKSIYDQDGPRSWIADAIEPTATCGGASSTFTSSSSCRSLGPDNELCPGTLTTLEMYECDDEGGEQRQPDLFGCAETSRPPGATRFACRAQLCKEVTVGPECKASHTEFTCPGSGAGSYVSGCTTRIDNPDGSLTFCCDGAQ